MLNRVLYHMIQKIIFFGLGVGTQIYYLVLSHSLGF